MKTRRVRFTISLGLVACGILVCLTPVCVCSQATEDEKAGTVLLPEGTPIHLVLMDDLQGKDLQIKQTVHFKVREDLVVGSKILVKTGTEAIGHIESVSKSGLLGKSGRLVLQFDYVETVSGTKIMLRGGAGVSGGKGGALTGLSAMWYGPNANLPVGTMINAYVIHDQQIPVP
ncbi:MAG: hypothetical protein ABSG32_28370 [Terriglobia bacterium]|jgi:hypothetical protein